MSFQKDIRWFQHSATANADLKLIRVLNKFGLEGYGFYWLCVEIASNSGETAKIKEDMGWKEVLIGISRMEKTKIDSFLKFFSEIDLIDSAAYEKGDLYMPKLLKYGDDYTKRVKRIAEQETSSFVQDTIKYFIKAFKVKFGENAVVDWGKDGACIKRRKGQLEDPEQAKKLIDEFLESEKGKECGYTLAVCFSSHTINSFFANTLTDNREDILFNKYATKKK